MRMGSALWKFKYKTRRTPALLLLPLLPIALLLILLLVRFGDRLLPSLLWLALGLLIGVVIGRSTVGAGRSARPPKPPHPHPYRRYTR